jgi:hypothetical protein
MTDAERPSYHDLYVTTAEIKRTSIFDLPYGLHVLCTRVGGWQLWDMNGPSQQDPQGRLPASEGVLLAGEYDTKGLRLDVASHIIVDSLTEQES